MSAAVCLLAANCVFYCFLLWSAENGCRISHLPLVDQVILINLFVFYLHQLAGDLISIPNSGFLSDCQTSPSIVRQVLFILLIQQEVFSGRLLSCCDPKVGTNMSGVQISVILNI